MSSSEATALVRLTAHAADENTRIEVLDGNLNIVPGSSQLGETTVDVPPGAYAVRFQIGTDYVQRIAILTPQSSETHVWLDDADAPRFATSAPVRHTKSTREFHREPAQRLSLSPPLLTPAGAPGDSHLLVFARDLIEGRHNDPAQGLSFHDLEGTLVADFAAVGERHPVDRWAGAHLELNAGAYRLRMSTGSRQFSEQIIYLCTGWQTEVFLLAGGVGDSERDRRVNLASASVLMAKPHEGFNPERQDLRWTESALRALRQAGNIPGSVRSEMLSEKFQNPMLGIYGGLLHLRRKKIDSHLLRQVFHNLMELVGPLPDVLAIGWGLALRDQNIKNDALFMQALNRPGDLATPPMLRASWDLLVEASVLQPELMPAGSFTERASTRLTAAGPWFSWRGEPPPLRDEPERASTLASEDSLPGILSKLLPPKFVQGLTTGTLGVTLPYLANLLARMPMAGYLLYSSRFTDVERRVAQYVYPLVDLQLRALVDGDEALTAEVIEGMKERKIDATGLVKSLKVPAVAALGAVWGLVRKLLLQPVVPHKQILPRFVTTEAHKNKILESSLRTLQKESTLLRHRRGGEPINALEFLYLCYRGSPAEPGERAPTSAGLAQLLYENEYVIGEEASLPDAVALDSILARVRVKVLGKLEKQAAKRKIRFAPGWQALVLPDPAAYKVDALLPAPIEPQAVNRPAHVGSDVNKNDLVAAVAGKTGLSKADSASAVDSVFDAISEALAVGDDVRLVGFGTFSVTNRRATQGRNPWTGERIQIKASKQPKFKAGKGLKDSVNR